MRVVVVWCFATRIVSSTLVRKIRKLNSAPEVFLGEAVLDENDLNALYELAVQRILESGELSSTNYRDPATEQ